MKNIRFKYVFLLMFALLFANLLSINVTRVEAEEAINLDNAYRGDIQGYWALVNYGDDLVGSDIVTIFLDPEAINNTDINYILINEVDKEGVVRTTYYQRGVHSQFAARFTYNFVTSEYGAKPLVIHLMGSLDDSYSECIEKIRVTNLERVRTIEHLTPDDFQIIQETTEMTTSPYKVYISIKNNPQDYRLKDVTYTYLHTNYDNTTSLITGNAIEDPDNHRYYFIVSENSTYYIKVADRFGFVVGSDNPDDPAEKQLSIVIDNFYGDVISIVASYDTAYTQHDVDVNIEVYDGSGEVYPSSLIDKITVTTREGVLVAEDIKNRKTFKATENGVYVITCTTVNGGMSITEVNITNIDREAPTVVVSNAIYINSSDVEKTPYVFDPFAQVIATDNATVGDQLSISAKYYYVPNNNPTCDPNIESMWTLLDIDIYRYLYSVNDVCVMYEVRDEALNSRSVMSKIIVSDNTKPTISYNRTDMTLEIGDDRPTNDELIAWFGLEVNDNSRIFNPEREFYVESDMSELNLEELGVYNIYVYAIDASGNEGIPVKFAVTVTVRRLFVEAVPNQYIVYGEPMIEILYTCNGNPCIDEILPRDYNKLIGELYINGGARYAGTYNINSSLAINSKKYKIELGNLGVFTVKKRTFKIVANSYSIEYKDDEPVLTWYMDTSVCHNGTDTVYSGDINAMDYSCTFVNGDSFGGGAYEYEVKDGITYYAGGIEREAGIDVKFDDAKNVIYYKIHVGNLTVREVSGGGLVNYYLDFYGLYEDVLYEDYARFYIYPKYVEVTLKDVTKIYGESDPFVFYNDDKVNTKREDGRTNYQYEFTCKAYKKPINTMTTAQCQDEIDLIISRVDGETVGEYEIIGTSLNQNYDVRTNEEFDVNPIPAAYLYILQRNITIEVDGDPKGSKKYTIIYEDELPDVTVSVKSDKSYEGLATGSYESINGGILIDFTDRLVIGENPIKYLDSNNNVVEGYISGVGTYKIEINNITIKNEDDVETVANYNITFNQGELTVIQRHIYIMVVEDYLTKVYGEADPDFSDYELPENSYRVIDGNNRFLLQIYDTFENNEILDEKDYEPLDKNLLKYYMKRSNIRKGHTKVDVHDGEMVGEYLVECEKFENATNYVINIYKDYYFKITERDLYITTINSRAEFNYDNEIPKLSYSYTNVVFGDTLVGQPSAEGFEGSYRNNGKYKIEQGNILALSSAPTISRVGDTWYINDVETRVSATQVDNLDLSLIEVKDGRYYIVDVVSQERIDTGVEVMEVDVMWNYKFNVTQGYLQIIPRDVVIVPEDNKSKVYGDLDPTIGYSIRHYVDGEVRDFEVIRDPSDFVGGLSRTAGEKPGTYEVVRGSLNPAQKGKENGYNFNIISVESGHLFTITKKDLTLRLAAAQWDEEEGIYKVELAYGEGLDTIAKGYKYMDGTSEAGRNGLCTLEMVNGVEVCHEIYDTVTGDYGIKDDIVPEDVGRYIITKGTLKIVRVVNTEIDVTDYYNFTFVEAVLDIVPRIIKIMPHKGQTKYYGDSVEVCDITFDYSPTTFVKPTDKFTGCLERSTTNVGVGGNHSGEEVGQYLIVMGTLKINSNYDLQMDGNVMYEILPRTIIVTAYVEGPTVKLGAEENSYTMQYEPYDPENPPFKLGYEISGMGLATAFGDKILNDVLLYDINDATYGYHGVGDYKVVDDELVLQNSINYTYEFNEAKFKVNKKVITIRPYPLTIIYGDEDTGIYPYDVIMNGEVVTGEDIPAYTGALSRIPGNDANKYKILQGDLDFGVNYEVDMETYPTFFTIRPRKVTITAHNASKVYDPSPEATDPEFTYDVEVEGDGFVIDVPFTGTLSRENEESHDVGKYQIIQGSLALNTNYSITYIPAVYEIYYVPVTDVYVKILSGEKYQLDGEEKPVRLYAQFNDGANPEFLSDVTWSVVKSGGFNIPFTKDANNIIEFTPKGIGAYTITASYNGISGYEYVYVETSNVSEIFINLTGGKATNILGDGEYVTYTATIHLIEELEEEMAIEWYAGDQIVCTSDVVGTTNSCSFIASSVGIGTHAVYAKISNVLSNTLELIIKDNEVPIIVLEKQGEIYYIESHLNHTENSRFYIDPGYKAIDDIDGDITKNVKVKGIDLIDYNKVGTYYIVYEVKDQHGHLANNYRTVIVQDTVAPVVRLEKPEYTNIVLEYGQPYADYGGAIATDAYDDNYGLEIKVYENSNLDLNKIGKYEITYFAVDSNGNKGQVTRTVNIKDTTKPTITLNGEKDMYLEYKDVYREYGAQFSDNYDGTYTLHPTRIIFIPEGAHESQAIEVAGVDTGVLGTYRLSYYQTDSSGNAPLEFPVRNVFVQDHTPPVIVLKGSNPYYLKYGTEYVDPGYEAIDNYDEEVVVTVREVIGNTLGIYYVYYDAVDSHGNSAQQVIRTIILVDLVSPTLGFTDLCPQYMVLEAITGTYPSECDIVDVGYTVTDDYIPDLDAIKDWVVITSDLDINTIGEYTVTYYVEDASHNKASLNRYITVVDTTPPTITLKEHEVFKEIDFFVEVFGEYQEPGWEVYDQYDTLHKDEGLETRVEVFTNLNMNKLNTYTIEYVAIDSSGNESEPVYREVTVRDAVPPVVTLIGDPHMVIERGNSYAEYGATAIDNYDGILTDIEITNQPTGKEIGTFEVKYCATDSSGNTGCAIREVLVQDTIPPVVLGVEDGAYYRTPVYIYYDPLTGTDEVLTGRLNNELITSPWYVTREGTYHLEVSDDAGNVTTIDFVIDTTPPVLYGANNGEYINHPVELYAEEVLSLISYRLNNGGYVTTTEQRLKLEVEGKYWVYAVDMAGNIGQTISFVVDTTPPIFTLTGVENGGITNTDVTLNTENDVIVSVNNKDIPTNYTFTENGYYQIVIRDLAGNDVFLQFVINKNPVVKIGNENVTYISQNNAIIKFLAKADANYPKSSGFIYAKPLLEGGFAYVSGTLFSDDEYSKLIGGEDVEFAVPAVGEKEMVVAFIVTLDELNKFTTQTVEGDDDSAIVYAIVALAVAGLLGGSFYFFVVVKRKKSEEEEEEEIIEEDDFYY